MKNTTAFFISVMISQGALAVTGGSSLVCQSAANSGSKQVLRFEVSRNNTTGVKNPEISLSVNGLTYELDTSDIQRQYGETIHDAALGVIVVSANNFDTGHEGENLLRAQVMAKPGTVQAFNQQGKLVQWNLKDDDGGECVDGYGKATFQGVFTGTLQIPASGDTMRPIPLDSQIMNCTLDYNTGSAC